MRTLPPRINLSKNRQHPGMYPVPVQFKPVQNFRYPIDNAHTFERWYMDTFTASDSAQRIYLPIQWTAYYCNHKFGNDPIAIKRLQDFISTIDRNKAYYTIVQFDDGILNDVTGLDLLVMGMSGGRIDYPLPLLCMPHRAVRTVQRDLTACFIGNNTHAIRAQLIRTLSALPGYYISTQQHNITKYCEVLARSRFALCPRGYGKTSFRIQEAIDHGAIPVYISDDHIVPYNNFDYGILAHPQDDLHALLSAPPQTGSPPKHLYTYKGCKHQLLQYLSSL